MSVFAIPPGVEVATAVARGVWARAGDPLETARTLLLVNTPRAARRIEEALADTAPGSALLPRVRVLTDLGADPLALPGVPPPIPPLRRHLRLVRLVEKFLSATEGAPLAATPAMAESLAAFLDEIDEAGLDPAALDGAADRTHAAHWERMLRFLEIVRAAWPAIRAEEEGGAPDPKARQRAAVAARIAAWEAAPPQTPVIAAGSTGAVASTAALLAAVARLPRGAVVLPGLDAGLDREAWERIAAGAAPEHPQAPFRRLLGALGLAPGEVPPWDGEAAETPRARLLREAFRPAPVTDAWVDRAPALAAEAEAATAGLVLVEAANQREEAGAIALVLREALEVAGRRAALVTPDAALARRVTAELARFGVLPDDSLGRPLASAPAAVFFRLVAEVAAGPPDPVAIAGLLLHPLARPGMERGAHLRFARAYEAQVLRERPAAGEGAALPPWPDPRPGGADWLARLAAALAPLQQAMAARAPLSGLVAAHRAAAEALSREAPDAPSLLADGPDGAALAAFLEALEAAAPAHGEAPVPAYAGLLTELLGREEIRPAPATPHPRIAILGPREARTHPAEVVVLAGLAEDVWPALPAPDPWLSRPMRAALGLPAPEERIGLSAHDLLHGAARERAVLTRAKRRGGAPSAPSRWLVRLTSLLEGVGGPALAAMRARGEGYLAAARALHRPVRPGTPAERPRPAPPAALRPRRFSVTDVERLVADPYAVYARKVLRLKPMPALGAPSDAADRGEMIHAILQRFTEATLEDWPDAETAKARLIAAAEAVLAEEIAWPDLRRLWRGRLWRVADWFVAREAARRQGRWPAGREVMGRMTLATPGGPVEITARADRIDLPQAGGGAAIYDYKSGAPPARKSLEAGRAQQLHLQAAILAEGGFEGLAPAAPETGAYIGLNAEELAVEGIAAELAEHMAHVAELIGHYLRDAPFVARALPDTRAFEGDYDHLSRRAEWDPTL